MNIEDVLQNAGLDVKSMSPGKKQMVINQLQKSLYNRLVYLITRDLDESDINNLNELLNNDKYGDFIIELDKLVPDFELKIEALAIDLVNDYKLTAV